MADRELLDALPGADTCPYHDLPPETTVWILTQAYSAERACLSYHEALIIDGLIAAAITARPPFTCSRCFQTSHNPIDAREGYCGACHDWTGRAHG